MTRPRPPAAWVAAVHRYFAEECPRAVQRSWWDEEVRAQIFTLEYERRCYRLVMDESVWWMCPDGAVALSLSALAENIRAGRRPRTCFAVRWHDHNLCIREQRR